MKFIILFLAVVVISTTEAGLFGGGGLGGSVGSSGQMGNNYQFGIIEPTDLLAASITIQRQFRLGKVIHEDYVYAPADPANAAAIKGIRIIDQKQKNGASASIVSGGPGDTSVTIRFTSKRGFGIHSIIEIYTV